MGKKSKHRAPSRKDTERIEELKQKYGAAPIENGLRLRPDDFLDEVDWRDRIDQHYTRIWLEFTYGGLFTEGDLTSARVCSSRLRNSSAWANWMSSSARFRARLQPERRRAKCSRSHSRRPSISAM